MKNIIRETGSETNDEKTEIKWKKEISGKQIHYWTKRYEKMKHTYNSKYENAMNKEKSMLSNHYDHWLLVESSSLIKTSFSLMCRLR